MRKDDEEMKERRGSIAFIIVTVCLVLVSAFCITGTVYSQSRVSEKELEMYYREKEKEMVREVREYLNQEGYENSGVTLTRVTEADGSREYTLTVHHGRISRMDEEGREELKKELSAFDFEEGNCTFCHEFLVMD